MRRRVSETLFDPDPPSVSSSPMQRFLAAGKHPVTRARSSDPETSFEAAPLSRDVLAAKTRRLIHDLLRSEPLTDEEIAAFAEAEDWFTSPSGMRTRRAELVAAGLIVDSGVRRRTVSGKRTIVWRRSDGDS